jgi:hypothetical protein
MLKYVNREAVHQGLVNERRFCKIAELSRNCFADITFSSAPTGLATIRRSPTNSAVLGVAEFLPMSSFQERTKDLLTFCLNC